jgi:hypothetical protein
MNSTLTYTEIGNFMQSVLYAIDEYLILSFTLMIVATVVIIVRRLLYWG